MRTDWDTFFLDIAKRCAQQGTCRIRNYGAVIVKDKRIIGTGYSGAPRGMKHCDELDVCQRYKMGAAPGTRYELCRSVHAEQNALIQAGREAFNCDIYISGIDRIGNPVEAKPCALCLKLMINAGIRLIYIGNETFDPKYLLNKFFDEAAAAAEKGEVKECLSERK